MLKFVDLHIHTKYTKNNGITDISELITKAKEFNMDSLAIVDSGNISGIPEFYVKCIENNIKPILGLGFYFAKDSRFSENDEKYHLVLLAENYPGFRNLVELAELSYTEGFYKRPRIDFELLKKYKEGLICLTGGLGGLIDKHLLAKKKDEALGYIDRFLSIFGKDNFFLELQDNGVPNNEIMIKELSAITAEKPIQYVVTGGSFYVNPEDAVKCNEVRTTNGNNPLKGDGYYFKSQEEILERFQEYRIAIDNSAIIAGRCNVKLDETQLTSINYRENTDQENILALKKIL